jgi:hypothetical protein
VPAEAHRLRPATAEDLPRIAEVHLRARDAAYPAMPHGVHPPHETRTWVTGWDLDLYEVWVAEAPGEAEGPLGYVRFDRTWLWSSWLSVIAAPASMSRFAVELWTKVRWLMLYEALGSQLCATLPSSG